MFSKEIDKINMQVKNFSLFVKFVNLLKKILKDRLQEMISCVADFIFTNFRRNYNDFTNIKEKRSDDMNLEKRTMR